MSENQRPTELTSLTASGTSRDVIKYSFPQRYAESYVGIMECFLDVVEGIASLLWKCHAQSLVMHLVAHVIDS